MGMELPAQNMAVLELSKRYNKHNLQQGKPVGLVGWALGLVPRSGAKAAEAPL